MRQRAQWAWRALVAASLIATAEAQQERWSFHGEARRQFAGGTACWLSDLDGDGVRDYAVGLMPYNSAFHIPATGGVNLCSGRDGSTIREWCHADRTAFGELVANGGDLDGDGVDDLLANAPSDVTHGDSIVSGWSGATGALLFELHGAPTPLENYGSSLVALGDLNGDGTPDFAIGVSYHTSVSNPGFVEFRSGLDQSLLATIPSPNATPLFGAAGRIAPAGDLDGDGVQDLLTAETFQPASSNLPNCDVNVWSGATRASLLQVTVLVPEWNLNQALCVAAVGDADGDGVPDLVVSVPRAFPGVRPGQALLLSGATGATLQTHLAPPASNLGRLCFAAGDVDGDGSGDFGVVVEAPGTDYLSIRSGSDGSELLQLPDDAPGQQVFAQSLAAGADVDGDGISELLIGCPVHTTGSGYHPAGAVQCRSLADGAILWNQEGVFHDSRWRSGVAFVDDQDGDGLPELALTDSTWLYANTAGEWALVLRSSRDGSELRRESNVAPLMGPFVSLPDVDGDGVTDFAASCVAWWAHDTGFPNPPFVEQVEIRSGLDLSLLATLTTAAPVEYFGWSVAAGAQPGGAVHVACGAPLHGATWYGQVAIHDAATGLLLFAASGDTRYTNESFGTSVAFAGDLDGDGVGDWAVGAPGHGSKFQQGGRVGLISGADGSSLGNLYGSYASQRMGTSVVAIGDHDGDGLDELAVTSEQANSTKLFKGRVELWSSATRTVYATIPGRVNNEYYGRSLVAVPDLDGDGGRDFVVGVGVPANGHPSRLELRSGRDGALLKYVEPEGASYNDAWLGAAPPPWLPAAPKKADGPWLASVDMGVSLDGYLTGRVALHELDDLYLDLFPSDPAANMSVEAATRGAPSGALGGLLLESIDGNPVGVFVAFGSFDAASSFAVTGTIPPGLVGQEWSFRGFGVGWNGKLVDSQSALLHFQ